MKSFTISSIGDPGTFTPLSSGDPTFYTEAASFDIRKLIYDMSNAGMLVEQPDTADVDGVVTWIQSLHSNLETYVEDISAYLISGGDFPDTPALPALPANYTYFQATIMKLVSEYYSTLIRIQEIKLRQVLNAKIEDSLDDIASGENTLVIGGVEIWTKSAMVDEI